MIRVCLYDVLATLDNEKVEQNIKRLMQGKECKVGFIPTATSTKVVIILHGEVDDFDTSDQEVAEREARRLGRAIGEELQKYWSLTIIVYCCVTETNPIFIRATRSP